jgi:4-hydroxybenzoyl-CoA thioesterase
MVFYDRPVKFEDVDAAHIVFFARFMSYAHEAMEHFFAPLQGGYVGLIVTRRIGLPAVRVEVDFTSPLRYGEMLCIETSVTRIGRRSATMRYRMVRAHDEVLVADLRHTVVTTDLDTLKSCPMPEDVRALLSAHLDFDPMPSAGGRQV